MPTVSIASIHATVLAIFISAVSIFALHFYSSLDQMEFRVFWEAEEINKLHFASGGGFPEQGIYVASDPKNRKQLLSRFARLSMGIPFVSDTLDPVEYEKFMAPAGRGEELIRIMNALSTYYPFTAGVEKVKPGEILHYPSRKISFNDIENVRQWITQIESITKEILWSVNQIAFKKALNAYNEDWNREFHRSMPERHLRTLTPRIRENIERLENIPMVIANVFIRNMLRADDISFTTRQHLEQMDKYKAKHGGGLTLVITLLLAALAFVCGVVIPMRSPHVRRLFLLRIPFGVYLIMFIYLMYVIIMR